MSPVGQSVGEQNRTTKMFGFCWYNYGQIGLYTDLKPGGPQIMFAGQKKNMKHETYMVAPAVSYRANWNYKPAQL